MALVKRTLLIISIILIIMGIMGALPNLTMGYEPLWHAIAKIIVGIIGVFIALKK